MSAMQESKAGRHAPDPRTPLPHPRRLRERMGISQGRMGRLLDVSVRTIQRWETRGAPPEDERLRRRLALIDEMIDLALLVYTEVGFREFVTTPLSEFDNCTALQMIEHYQEERVLAVLASDHEGLGY